MVTCTVPGFPWKASPSTGTPTIKGPVRGIRNAGIAALGREHTENPDCDCPERWSGLFPGLLFPPFIFFPLSSSTLGQFPCLIRVNSAVFVSGRVFGVTKNQPIRLAILVEDVHFLPISGRLQGSAPGPRTEMRKEPDRWGRRGLKRARVEDLLTENGSTTESGDAGHWHVLDQSPARGGWVKKLFLFFYFCQNGKVLVLRSAYPPSV